MWHASWVRLYGPGGLAASLVLGWRSWIRLVSVADVGGVAGLGGADSEAAQALGQPVAADGPAGLAAGEQPGRGALVTEDGVPAPGRHQAGCEGGQRFGQRDGGLPEPEPDLA